MLRATILIACLAATAAYAQEADDPCAPSDGPRISEGLPGQGCRGGVVINRGPEVAPEASEVREEEPEPERRRVIRRPVSPWGDGYSSRIYIPRYAPVAVPARQPQLSFTYRDDNVFLRIGPAPHRQPRKYRDYVPEPETAASGGIGFGASANTRGRTQLR